MADIILYNWKFILSMVGKLTKSCWKINEYLAVIEETYWAVEFIYISQLCHWVGYTEANFEPLITAWIHAQMLISKLMLL